MFTVALMLGFVVWISVTLMLGFVVWISVILCFRQTCCNTIRSRIDAVAGSYFIHSKQRIHAQKNNVEADEKNIT